MNMINVYYKKPEWREWVCWTCSSEEEAEQVKEILREQGYEVR